MTEPPRAAATQFPCKITHSVIKQLERSLLSCFLKFGFFFQEILVIFLKHSDSTEKKEKEISMSSNETE